MPSILTVHFTLDEKESIKLKFSSNEFNWENLVNSIIKSKFSSCIDLPIIIYYHNGSTISSLKNQEQLSKLPIRSSFEFYSQKELVKQSAFERLGQLIQTHKKIISSFPPISRGIGILASAIALDTNNKDFNNEFEALEKVILSRKDQDPLTTDTFQNIDTSNHIRGFGHGFGGIRGHHRHHHCELSEERLGKKHHKSCKTSKLSTHEIDTLRAQLSNTHIDKHGKEFKKCNSNPYAFEHHSYT